MFERSFLFINKQFDIATQGVRSKNKLTVKVRTNKSKDDFGFNLNLNSIYKLSCFSSSSNIIWSYMSHVAVWQSKKAKSGNSHIERNFD